MKNPLTSLVEYLRSSKAELEKVTWPTRQVTLHYSLLVVGVSVIMAAFFAALDFGLGRGVDLALSGRPSPAASSKNLPVVPDLQPIESSGPTIEGVDENGNTVPLNVTPLPLDTNKADNGITVTP